MKVRARALDMLLQEPVVRRIPILAEGLQLLVEHIGELHRSVAALRSLGQARAGAIIDAVAGEEAAKVLIILDLVRMGFADQVAAKRQIRAFSDHMARGIYARATQIRPAYLAEVRAYVERLRVSHYLDGPNDVDWIFRNEVESDRESTFYVDYVADEEICRWDSPSERFESEFSDWKTVVELVLALERTGLLTENGLLCLSDAWADVVITDSSSWAELITARTMVFELMDRRGALRDDWTDEDLRVITESWGFPLSGLPLRRRNVPLVELQTQRENGLESLYRDWAGISESDFM